MKGVTDNMMLLIFGLVILFLVLGMIISLTYTALDDCWGNTYNQVKAIQSAFNEIPNVGDNKVVYVELESCTEGVVLMNKEEFYNTFSRSENFPAIKNNLNCPDEFQALIVAAPRLKEGASFFGGVSDFARYNDATQAREWGIQYIKQSTNTQTRPICESVPVKKAVLDNSTIKEMPTLGGKFCINVMRTGDLKFGVMAFDKVESKDHCIKSQSALKIKEG